MEFSKLTKKIYAEIDIRKKMTDNAIFKFVLEETKNPYLTEQYLITEGGYTKKEINRIVYRLNDKRYLTIIK